MGIGASQAKGLDLLRYWHSALQHRMLADTRKHPSHCCRKAPGALGEEWLVGCCTWALLD